MAGVTAKPPPPGVYVPVPTFFVSRNAPNYSSAAPPLDLETQAKHAIHLAKSGIRGLVVLGSTGEAVAVTSKERSQLLRHIRAELEKANFQDYPIIAGTYTQGIENTIQQLEDAETAGAQYGLVLAPGYFAMALNQDGLKDWYNAIAEHSPIPIMIYHYPAVSNNMTIAASTFQALAAHPNIVGCKLSHSDLSLHTQVASSPHIDSNHFAVFTGLGQQLLPVLTVGGAGAIDGLAAIFPRVVARLWEATTQGAMDEARSIQEAVCRGEELVVGKGVPGIKSAVSRILGMGDEDGTRLPLKGGMSDDEWAKWADVMNDLGALEQELASGSGQEDKNSVLDQEIMAVPKAERDKAALIVVDMQEDFCPPSGSLAIDGARDIVHAINSLLAFPFALKIATKDWHPADHVSFYTSHTSPDIKPFQSSVTVSNPENPSETQEIPVWPIHCVQNTNGAEIIPEIDVSKVDTIVEKGRDKRVEMFSVFSDSFGRKGEALSSHDVAGLLRNAGVTQVFVTGLAGDYCALHTAMDAKKEGFEVFLVEDAVKSVNPGQRGWGASKKNLHDIGVSIVSLNGPELEKIKGVA